MILFVLLIFLLQNGCNDVRKDTHDSAASASIDNEQYRLLSNRYSKEAINYFYELCFYDEFQKREIGLSKWNSDIQFYIDGDQSKNDIRIVESVIEKLNSIKLPIKFSLVDKLQKANVIIYFGDSLSLKPLGFINGNLGLAFRTSRKGVIFNGKILILDSKSDPVERESILLEEMTQIIGSITDSFSHPKSVFFQGFNYPIDYQVIDVEIMKLLYDTLIPAGYSIENYQDDLGDIIDYYNTSEKLKKMFIKEGVKKSTLEDIKESCYLDKEFYKHPKEIPVYLSGFDRNDSIFVSNALEFFNGLSTNINLEFDGMPEDVNSTGISIKLLVNDSQDYPTETNIWNTKGEVFKPKRIKSEAEISYRSSVELKKKRSVILKAIYKSLGPTEMHFQDDWFTYDGGKVSIDQKYADIIRIIYSDEFVDGYPMEEFEELIKSF